MTNTLIDNAEELLAENAMLRDKLHRTEQQRVMDEIVQQSVNKFLEGASTNLSILEEHVVNNSITNNNNEENKTEESKNITHEIRESVSETLSQLVQSKQSLEKQLQLVQTEKIKTLNTQIEHLLHDKQALQTRIKELEKSIHANLELEEEEQLEEQPHSSVNTEIKLLRQSEKILQEQLEKLQQDQVESINAIQSQVSTHISTLTTLPEMTNQLAQLQTQVQSATITSHVTSLVAEEDAKRQDAWREVMHSQINDITDMYENKVQNLRDELKRSKAEQLLVKESNTQLQSQLSNLQAEFEAYKTTHKTNNNSEEEFEEEEFNNKHDEGDKQEEEEEEEEVAGMSSTRRRKRRRCSASHTDADANELNSREKAQAEKEQLLKLLDNLNSRRGEFIRFWYEGKDAIARLEEEVKTLKENTEKWHKSELTIRELEHYKTTLSLELVDLTQEIDKLRKANQDQRAEYAGLSAERDFLLTVLTSAIAASILPLSTKITTTTTSPESEEEEEEELITSSSNKQKSEKKETTLENESNNNNILSPEAVEECCATIRNAAAAQAAASATIVEDDKALQEAKRNAFELQNSVSQLEKRKEQLLKVITLREHRLKALLEREALTLSEIRESNNTNVNNVHLPDLLEYMEQITKDVMDLLTEDTSNNNINVNNDGTDNTDNSNNTNATNTHFTLQRKFITSQEKLLQSQRRVQQLLIEKDDLTKQLDVLKENKTHEVQTQQEQLATLEVNNNNLTTQAFTLQSQLESLCKHYIMSIQLNKQILDALRVVMELLQTERTHSEECRKLITHEREAMVNLLEREAEMWSTAAAMNDNNNISTSNDSEVSTLPSMSAAQSVLFGLQRLQTYMEETIAMQQLRNEQDKTKYIARLAHVLHEHESVIQQIRNKFTQVTKDQAQALTEKLLAAQSSWDSIWESKYKQLEEEQEGLQANQFAQSELWRRLEQSVHDENMNVCLPIEKSSNDVVVKVNNDDKQQTQTLLEQQQQKEEKEKEEREAENVVMNDASPLETLSVIKRFLLSAKAQLQVQEQQEEEEEEENLSQERQAETEKEEVNEQKMEEQVENKVVGEEQEEVKPEEEQIEEVDTEENNINNTSKENNESQNNEEQAESEEDHTEKREMLHEVARDVLEQQKEEDNGNENNVNEKDEVVNTEKEIIDTNRVEVK